MIAISETRITKQVSLSNNLNLNNFSFEFTTTETSAGGILLYIANHLSYINHTKRSPKLIPKLILKKIQDKHTTIFYISCLH